MPWTVSDVDRHKNDLSAKQKRQWVAVANGALERCLRDGGSQVVCEGRAVRMANATAGATREANEVGMIFYGHTPEIMQHNIEVLKANGYEEEVAKDIASQIAGLPMPSEEPAPEPKASATATVEKPPEEAAGEGEYAAAASGQAT